MERLLKIEMHAHSKGGSGCASASPEDIASEFKSQGYDGLVLTNHICESEFNKYPGDTKTEKLDFYFSLYEDVRSACEKVGLKVFYGTEVRAKHDGFIEFMLYGFEKEFLYNAPLLFTLTQKELFELCEREGVLMYQTHPFRRGVCLGDPKYMHGAEYFNGHVNHINNNADARKFIDQNNLLKTCGTDYHDPGQPLTAYALIPESINTNKQLADYIRSGNLQIFGDEEKYVSLCRKK